MKCNKYKADICNIKGGKPIKSKTNNIGHRFVGLYLKNLSILLKNKSEVNGVIDRMQKAVLSESAHLVTSHNIIFYKT